MRHKPMIVIPLVLASVALGACTTDTPTATETGPAEAPEAPETTSATTAAPESDTPGVSDDTITLGVLTDLSGVFAAQGQAIVEGEQIYWDQINQNGGVCARSVELTVRDNGYSTQTAVTQLSDIEDQVLAIDQVLGSSVLLALEEELESQNLFTISIAFSSEFLDSPVIAVPATPYKHETAAGISWLVEEQGLSEGDTLGIIYLEGGLGDDSLAGAEMAADQFGLDLQSQQVSAADSDLTGPIQALTNAGAQYIYLTTPPGQTASAVSVAAASGAEVTFMGSGISFVPSLLDGAAGEFFAEGFFMTSPWAPMGSEIGDVPQVRELYESSYPDVTAPNLGPMEGWAGAAVMNEVLSQACDDGKLSREAVITAFRELEEVDTDGVTPPLQYNEPGEPPATGVFILQPDAEAFGSLTVVSDGVYEAGGIE